LDFDCALDALADKLALAAEHLEQPRADVLAFTAFPMEVWRQLWSNDPTSGSTAGSVGTPPSAATSPTATPSLTHRRRARRTVDEWAEGRRHLGLDILARSCISPVASDPEASARDDRPGPLRRSSTDPTSTITRCDQQR